MSTRTAELVKTLQSTLEELVELEQASNQGWRKHTDTLNELDHELEIVPLNAPQLAKVASFRKRLRLERRTNKNDWYCVKAFNDAFQTQRILNSMANAQRNLGRQMRQGENLIENRGLIASILAPVEKPQEPVWPPEELRLKQAADNLSEAFGEVDKSGEVIQ